MYLFNSAVKHILFVISMLGNYIKQYWKQRFCLDNDNAEVSIIKIKTEHFVCIIINDLWSPVAIKREYAFGH